MNQWYVIYCLIHNSDNKELILSCLSKDLFIDDLPLNVFMYIEELINKGVEPTTSLVESRFTKDKDKLFLDCNIDATQYEEYLNNLRLDYSAYKIKEFGTLISNKEDIDEKSFITYTNKLLDSLQSTEQHDNLVSASDVIDIVLERANAEEEVKSPIRLGIETVDKHFSGLRKGDLIVVAGRPSMGKSGLMCWSAKDNADRGFVCPVFSLEMKPEDIILRLLAGMSDLELWKFKRIGHRTPDEQKRMISAAKRFKEMKLFIDSSPALGINQMRSVLQKIKLQQGRVDAVYVDYLQLMSGQKEENDNSRISALSRGMKHIAMEFDCPVILGSQLSRGCEVRDPDNKRPLLSDLRDSGAIEQDADIVIMLYRDCYYTQNPEHSKILELLIRKFRNGEVGKVVVEYNIKKQSFKDMNFNTQLGKMAEQFKYK